MFLHSSSLIFYVGHLPQPGVPPRPLAKLTSQRMVDNQDLPNKRHKLSQGNSPEPANQITPNSKAYFTQNICSYLSSWKQSASSKLRASHSTKTQLKSEFQLAGVRSITLTGSFQARTNVLSNIDWPLLSPLGICIMICILPTSHLCQARQSHRWTIQSMPTSSPPHEPQLPLPAQRLLSVLLQMGLSGSK